MKCIKANTKSGFLIILFLLSGFITGSFKDAKAQCNAWANLVLEADTFSNPAFGNNLSPEIDRLNRPYIYAAQKDGGLKIYEIVTGSGLTHISSVPVSSLNNLDVISLFQDSIYLYATLGDIWNTNQTAGLAIINVSDPLNPVVSDYYAHAGSNTGAACVKVVNNVAYLAAMQSGLILLDVADKSDIKFLSQLSLSNTFPHNPVGAATMYNVRGLDVKDSLVYVCFDKGGLRVINVKDTNNPVQINQYCNPGLINYATAYNNIVINSHYAYIALDYYGMEVIDIAQPTALSLVGYWHPSSWADATNDYNTWASSKGHANEIVMDTACNLIYLAAGRTDVAAISVLDASNPLTCEEYGSNTDQYGTWGLDFFNRQIALSYIWSPFFTPYSNYTGIKYISTSNCDATGTGEKSEEAIVLFPNPKNSFLNINMRREAKNIKLEVYDVTGVLLFSNQYVTTSLITLDKKFTPGIYQLIITLDSKIETLRFIQE